MTLVNPPDVVPGNAVEAQWGNDMRDRLTPIGGMIIYFGTTAPTGPVGVAWKIPNGQALLRASYPQLFTLFGTRYGAGNGTTTFNIPNVMNSFPFVSGNNGTDNGVRAGEFSHVLTAAEMPSHSHEVIANNQHLVVAFKLPSSVEGLMLSPSATRVSFTDGAALPQGGNAAHNNMPPYTIGMALLRCL